MLVLPPGNAETLANVAEQISHRIVPCAIIKDLVVQKVVCQPTALLPKNGHQCTRQPDPPEPGQHTATPWNLAQGPDGGGQDGIVEEDLEEVVRLTGIEKAGSVKLATKGVDFPGELILVVVRLEIHPFLGIQVTGIKIGQRLVRTLGVERSEHIYTMKNGSTDSAPLVPEASSPLA